MADVDHGLSQAGREQAEQLWRRLELEACLADLMPRTKSSELRGGAWSSSAHVRCTPLRGTDLMADAAVAHAVAKRSEAERAAAADHVRALWRAQAIWASPLTRAVQTALIAFQGHPTLAAR
jgi:broad specificity phosphatase PhoE